jgi:tetratricopeptide (TPR) repeat protein
MARAAVKAKQAQKQAQRGAPAKAAPRRQRRRGRHAGGGNPNQQLFFMRLRRQAKFAYVFLAVLFAVTFAFLGVGSGSSGLDQLFSGLNIFHHGGTSVSKAQKEIAKHPSEPKGYRDLATAYETKGDTTNAISALQQYTNIKRKDAAAWNELAGLQLTQAGEYAQRYSAAVQAGQAAAPSQALVPTSGNFGKALGTNQLEQVASQAENANVSDLSQRAQLAYGNAVSSYTKVTELQPRSSNAWLSLAQAAQTANESTTAVKAYKRYLKLNPDSSTAPEIKQLIKQLSPPPPKAPAKKKK